MEKKIENYDDVFPLAIDPAGEPDGLLGIARLFCTNTNCEHYNSACADGNELVWVECPIIAQHLMETRDLEGIIVH